MQAMKKLLEVEEVDGRIAALDAAVAALPGQRATYRQDLVDANGAIVTTHAALEEAELAERRLESQMKDQEAQRTKLDAQMSEITSKQAYEALQREIDHARDAGSEFETQALELMEKVDQARQANEAAVEEAARLEPRTVELLEEVDLEEQRLVSARSKLVEERNKHCEGVPDDFLQRYEKVAARKSPAVAVLTEGTCSKCHLRPPSLLTADIKRAEKLQACPSCKRLLLPESVLET